MSKTAAKGILARAAEREASTMKLQIVIDLEVDRPFENAEQERYVLASIESAFAESWFEWLASEEEAPQQFSNVRARFCNDHNI